MIIFLSSEIPSLSDDARRKYNYAMCSMLNVAVTQHIKQEPHT